ncbi:MAG: ATPase [Crocosphaera sp.]|jgi:phage terminase small subunit
MNVFDIQSLITTVDELIFSHTGEHLDDLQWEILEGVVNHQKYDEIAKNHHRSPKYVRDTAGKLWNTLSEILGEDVNKSNVKSSIKRYCYYNFYHYRNLKDVIQINSSNFCTGSPEKESQSSNVAQETKIKIATELIKEGLSVEQISRVLELPLELVKEQIEKSE